VAGSQQCGELMYDPPFAVPPDIVLSLPAPISINRSRRIDWNNYPKVKEWIRQADALFLSQKRKLPPAIKGRYEVIITLQDGSQTDADNSPKLLIDFIRRVQLVTNDNPKYMRQVTILFGEVDEGCQIVIRPIA
jgi:hypothetical protein